MDKYVEQMKKVFVDAIKFSNKERPHGAYLFLNSKSKEAALRAVAREMVVDGLNTGLFVVNGGLYKIEPITDNSGAYVCEEAIYVGKLSENPTVTLDFISSDIF